MIKAIVTILALGLPQGMSTADRVELDRQVTFLGVELPRETAPGQTLPVDLYFGAQGLAQDEWIFVHLESNEGENCRIVQDRPAPPAMDGIVHHHLDLPVPPDCRPARFELYTGVYSRTTMDRLKVLAPVSMDDRVHAGYLQLRSAAPDDSSRTITPSDMRWQSRLSLFLPWRHWVLGILAACLLTVVIVVLRRRAGAALPEPLSSTNGPRVLASTAIIVVPLVMSILAALDFVKDDAYISFRYAHNLVAGKGLVFNPGDRLEGYTNFLWTVLMAPFEAMHADLFQVCEILGTILAIVLVVAMTLTMIHVTGTGRWLGFLWAGLWMSTQSSLGLWATSGLELPLAMTLPVAGALVLWQGEKMQDRRWALASGILMGLGCMTRPDEHLMAIIVGMPLVIDVMRTRRISAFTLTWFVGLIGTTLPFHSFRFLYYGSLVPNTFYVKTGASTLLMVAGLRKLHEMFSFNAIGALVLLVPFAFLDGRRLKEKLVMAFVAFGYMAYIVKVGVDEMQWHRLYLPALPFLAMLAMIGLRAMVDHVTCLVRGRTALVAAHALAWALVIAGAAHSFIFTYRSMSGFNGRGDLSGTYHPDLGKFIVRHERPGALVAFQDMGSTPYHAPDIDFLDFIGLTEGPVARARYAYGLNAYTATENYRNQTKYDAEMREYFFQRNPEWTILTVYVHGASMGPVAQAFAMNPGPESLRSHFANNGYQFGIWKDQRFHDRYVHVRTWPRSASYYLSLFRRRDLWEKTPREVVLDALPAGVAGARATFGGGLELLGSDVEGEALEKTEFYVTTWWKAPGPMEPDLNFFLHLNGPGTQVAYDHVPGDWMYPADRWQSGDVIENRVLFQVPFGLAPGTYQLFLGAYHRTTSVRLDVVQGTDDGTDRIYLGDVTIAKMYPLVDQTILTTDLDKHRKYPELITDPGRTP